MKNIKDLRLLSFLKFSMQKLDSFKEVMLKCPCCSDKTFNHSGFSIFFLKFFIG